MGRNLVLVADSSKARIMEKNGSKLHILQPVYERDEIVTDFDLGSAKPGRIKAKALSSTHSYSQRSDVHRIEKDQFLREVAKHLNNGISDMESLVLVAPPQTLGDLRKLLSQHVLSKVDHEVAKDLTKLREDELLSYVTKPYH
jgi:protein required for attachment to host cells